MQLFDAFCIFFLGIGNVENVIGLSAKSHAADAIGTADAIFGKDDFLAILAVHGESCLIALSRIYIPVSKVAMVGHVAVHTAPGTIIPNNISAIFGVCYRPAKITMLQVFPISAVFASDKIEHRMRWQRHFVK